MKLRLLVALLFMPILAWANISSQVNRTGPFTFAGSPQVIPVGMPFQQGSDLLVLDMGTIAVPHAPVTLTLGSDYTVSGGSYNASTQMQTGSITVVSGGANAVQTNDQIIIIRNVPVNQITSFSPTGPLTIQLVEKALDKQATLSQQLTETSLRSLRFPVGEILSGLLPLAARSGKVLGFDSNGAITYYAFSGGTILPQSITGTAGQVLVNGTFGVPTTGAVTLTLASGSTTAQGTANQVLVNGTSGSAQNSPWVFTTPQNIGTTSTPQFSKLGLGTATTTSSDLVINHSVPATNAAASMVVQGSLTAPIATDLHPNAFRDTTLFTSTVAADAYASFDAQTGMLGAQNYNHYIGFQARHNFGGSGTLGRLEGFSAFMGVSAGTVTEARGFYAPNLSVTGGTVTHYSGLYIDQLSAGTTRHAIYHNGNDPWFSAGGQIFTSALLALPSGATTCVMGGTFNQSTQTGLAVMNSNATATGTMLGFYNNGGTYQGGVTQTNSTTVAYNTSSDIRLKENLRDFKDSGRIIDGLRPRLGDWKKGTQDVLFFVAQEVNVVDPILARSGVVTAGDSGEEIKQVWQVDPSKLAPVLVAEAKDLRVRVARLERNQTYLWAALFATVIISVTIRRKSK